MKKWVVFGLGSTTVAIWGAVLLVLFIPQDSNLSVNNHSTSPPLSLTTRTVEMGKIVRHFERKESSEEQGLKTGIMKHKLSKAWVEDVSEDGKLSIDTLLETLDLNNTEAENS